MKQLLLFEKRSMSSRSVLSLSQLESSLWEAADQLRANSKLNASEYSMPVLGLIFLRHATNRYEKVRAEIEQTLPLRGGKMRSLTPADFTSKAALFLPENARYDYLMALPEGAKLGEKLDEAMKAIEADSELLKGVLPKDYAAFDKTLLRDLVRIFGRDELRNATGDVFGRIYEYFLNKFAMSGAQEGGEFFTPPSLVRTIVNTIEPKRGVVFDPACGSAGMFVQTGHFLEQVGSDPAKKVTFYGQELSETNTRLAKMNLAVHGLEGEIKQSNTFYDFRAELVGKCDYVMANPPFNVDMVDPKKIKHDERLFTQKKVPGISAKTKTVSNANYLWIQYFYSYLKPGKGRAGFVMASSASDAGHGEKEIREELIATGDVDAIISIGTNFFYTRSLPCTLWFFDRGKPAERKDKILMLDARGVYRVVTRKVNDFSDEQLQNLAAIAWLYRGETERFLALVRGYAERVCGEAETIAPRLAAWDEGLSPLRSHLTDLEAALAEVLKQAASKTDATEDGITKAQVEAFVGEREALEKAITQLGEDRAALQVAWAGLGSPHGLTKNEAQHEWAAALAERVPLLKAVQKGASGVSKLLVRVVEMAEKELKAGKKSGPLKDWNGWKGQTVRKERRDLEALRDEVTAAIKQVLYFQQQMVWLQSRFPQGVMVDVPGLCRVIERGEVEDGSLTPGRYVGVAPQVEDEDEETFEVRMREIHAELAGLNAEAVELATAIQKNFEELL